MNYTKGNKNKLNIGDKVQSTKHIVEWHVKHLNYNYLVPGHSEFTKHLSEIASWLYAYQSWMLPKGKVVGYGAPEDNKNYSFIRVDFKMKFCTITGYFSELTHLKKVK